MQLKYNRQQSVGSFILKTLIKIVLVVVFLFVAFFLIEKIKFPSPQKNFKIEVTDEIKKLK